MSIATLKKSFYKRFPTSGAFTEFRYGTKVAAKTLAKKIHNRVVIFSGLESSATNDDSRTIYNAILAVLYDIERMVDELVGERK